MSHPSGRRSRSRAETARARIAAFGTAWGCSPDEMAGISVPQRFGEYTENWSKKSAIRASNFGVMANPPWILADPTTGSQRLGRCDLRVLTLLHFCLPSPRSQDGTTAARASAPNTCPLFHQTRRPAEANVAAGLLPVVYIARRFYGATERRGFGPSLFSSFRAVDQRFGAGAFPNSTSRVAPAGSSIRRQFHR
jgi:hypothetical protein